MSTQPFSIQEGSSAVGTRAELLRHRQKETLRSVLAATGRADEPLPASPRAADDDDPRAGITLGLASLSRSQSELITRRRHKKKEDSLKAAPTKVPGVHKDALPSYAKGPLLSVSM